MGNSNSVELEREKNRHKEENNKIMEVKNRLKEEKEKNRHKEEQMKNRYQEAIERLEEKKYEQDMKMKGLEIGEKKMEIEEQHNPELRFVLVNENEVDKKRSEFMAKLMSDKTAVSSLHTMLDKNPNIFKEMGMEDGAAGEFLANALAKLEVGAEAESAKRPSIEGSLSTEKFRE